MKNKIANILIYIFFASFGLQSIGAQEPAAQTQTQAQPEIEELGNERYRIGEIEIDKNGGTFSVPGKVLRDEPPLEFLVITKDGHKAYESALEVNADANQFNLACILIGLDATKSSPPDEWDLEKPVQGEPVEVSVSWEKDGEMITVNGSDILVHGTPPTAVAPHNWVYTGSYFLPDGRYLAELSGTLLGFVKRGESIIEHREGLGLGNYGSVAINRKIVPPVGSPITLTIRAGAAQQR